MSSSSPDRRADFVIDAREHLSCIEGCLLALEKSPADGSAKVDRCLRALHSIKGDSGFLGLVAIHQLAHVMEAALETLKAGPSARQIQLLLEASDQLGRLMTAAERGAAANDETTDSIVNSLIARLQTGIASGERHVSIDLAGLESAATGLTGLFQQIAATGTFTGGSLAISGWDLRQELTAVEAEGFSVVWSTEASSPAHRVLLQRMVGLNDDTVRVTGIESAAFSIDLSDVDGGLVERCSRLADLAPQVTGRLQYSARNLADGLPEGDVQWAGTMPSGELVELLLSRWSSRTSATATPGTQGASAGGNTSSYISAEITDRVDGITERQRPVIPAAAAEDHTLAGAPANPLSAAGATSGSESERTGSLRIQLELLDRLMTLVGELTLVRNQSLMAFASEDGPQRAIIQRLNSVTSELQDATLRARMQPVGNLFSRFPRVVRDLARQLGKQVELELIGREVELDKTILEQLSDPLTHLIRNSVDHGIELPADRIAAGKPETGRITLSASHEDGQVLIEIRDDGRGIDAQAVRRKALTQRLKSEAELERMTQRELLLLILLPGFSTAANVTEVSGRGVGMDVVKTNIEQLEGTLTIESLPGLGCSMALRLPLTLAIIRCLIVRVSGERYAVPQRDLEEVVCLHPGSSRQIEQAYDTEVYRLRERLLPIVRFREVLKSPRRFDSGAEPVALGPGGRIEYILVLKLAGRRFGLVVDEVQGTQEIVVKPLHSAMKRIGIFTGATIMGDGRVALIADAEGIVEHARLSFRALERSEQTVISRQMMQPHRVLLFEYGPNERFALPLLQIRRVELTDRNRIEQIGAHEYLTADDGATRILRLHQIMDVSEPEAGAFDAAGPAAGKCLLILLKFVPQPMGVLVTRIVDTESLAVELQQHPEQNPCVLGSAIVRDRLTLFLDVHRLSQRLFGEPAVEEKSAAARFAAKVAVRAGGRRLLLIDDTAFFREVVKRYLSSLGHEIVTAVNGEAALQHLMRDQAFDLIVSDIEMPVMDGWDFAREARRRGIRTPLLALTSLSGMEYEVKARECGFDSYEVKLDHDRLVRKVQTLLAAAEASG